MHGNNRKTVLAQTILKLSLGMNDSLLNAPVVFKTFTGIFHEVDLHSMEDKCIKMPNARAKPFSSVTRFSVT